jgi:hypothetical protein
MLLWDVDGGAERPVLGGNGRSSGQPTGVGEGADATSEVRPSEIEQS